MAQQMERDPERTVDAVARAMSGADSEIAGRPEARRVLAEIIAEAFRQGWEGAARDVVLLGRPWGFDVHDIKVPVLLWQGEEDVLVPLSMGRYLAAAIPDCRARFFPGEGHLLVVDHMAEILEEFEDPDLAYDRGRADGGRSGGARPRRCGAPTTDGGARLPLARGPRPTQAIFTGRISTLFLSIPVAPEGNVG